MNPDLSFWLIVRYFAYALVLVALAATIFKDWRKNRCLDLVYVAFWLVSATMFLVLIVVGLGGLEREVIDTPAALIWLCGGLLTLIGGRRGIGACHP